MASCSVNYAMTAKPMPQISPSKPLKASSLALPLPESSRESLISRNEISIWKSRRSSRIGISRCAPSRILVPIVKAVGGVEPLKIMISGAPASGKGTQCELITKKYGLVHIAAGDLLRAEVAAGSENGKRAKEHMEKGLLVPNEIVVMMVKERLLQPDAQRKGWLFFK